MNKQQENTEKKEPRNKEAYGKDKAKASYYKSPLCYSIIATLIIIGLYFNINWSSYIFIPKAVNTATEPYKKLQDSKKDNTTNNGTILALVNNATENSSSLQHPLTINNDTANSILHKIKSQELENKDIQKPEANNTEGDVIINPDIIKIATYLLVFLFIATFTLAASFLIKKKQFSKSQWLAITLFAIFFIISLFLWYAMIWFPYEEKKVEAFTGLTSALASLGFIVTIFFQVYHHNINQRSEMKQLRIQYLTKKIDICFSIIKEKKQEVNDDLNKGFSSLFMNKLAKKMKREKYQNEEELKREILSYFMYNTHLIYYQSELESLIFSLDNKKVTLLRERGDNYIQRLKSLAIDKKVTSKNFGTVQEKFYNDLMNYYANN